MKIAFADLNRAFPIRPFLRQQPVVIAVAVLATLPWVLIAGWYAALVAAILYPVCAVVAYVRTARHLSRTQRTQE